MSFDMNPADDDPHGECRHEIKRLESVNAELLSACQDFARELQDWCDSNTAPTDSTMSELMARTKAAIAQATGGGEGGGSRCLMQ